MHHPNISWHRAPAGSTSQRHEAWSTGAPGPHPKTLPRPHLWGSGRAVRGVPAGHALPSAQPRGACHLGCAGSAGGGAGQGRCRRAMACRASRAWLAAQGLGLQPIWGAAVAGVVVAGSAGRGLQPEARQLLCARAGHGGPWRIYIYNIYTEQFCRLGSANLGSRSVSAALQTQASGVCQLGSTGSTLGGLVRCRGNRAGSASKVPQVRHRQLLVNSIHSSAGCTG